MGDLTDRMLWAYRAVFTQAAVGGGSININITSNDRIEILYGMIGPDDYAADRTLSILIEDSSDNIIARMVYSTPIDNERIPFPVSKASAAIPADQTFEPNQHVIIGDTDNLQLKISSLVQNETFTIIIRALIMMTKPTVTTTGSGGTVTTAETYNKVI